MTWTCPTCGMCYPDNAPQIRDEKYCTNCVVNPRDLETFIEEKRMYAKFIRSTEAPDGLAQELEDMADELEMVIRSNQPEEEPLLDGQSVSKRPGFGNNE